MVDSKQLRYISGAIAQDIDTEMMGPEGGFALEQLMELAALSVAEALFAISPIGPKLPRTSCCCRERIDHLTFQSTRTGSSSAGPTSASSSSVDQATRSVTPVHRRITTQFDQGGDGLIAARHLYNYGYAPSIFYPVVRHAYSFVPLTLDLAREEPPLRPSQAAV